MTSFSTVNCQDCCYNFRRNSWQKTKKKRIRTSAHSKFSEITWRSNLYGAERNKGCNTWESMSFRIGNVDTLCSLALSVEQKWGQGIQCNKSSPFCVVKHNPETIMDSIMSSSHFYTCLFLCSCRTAWFLLSSKLFLNVSTKVLTHHVTLCE